MGEVWNLIIIESDNLSWQVTKKQCKVKNKKKKFEKLCLDKIILGVPYHTKKECEVRNPIIFLGVTEKESEVRNPIIIFGG